MFEAKLIAIVTEKKYKKISATYEVMKMNYKIKENVLWVTDHRGSIHDFDLDDFDVEIKTKE